MKKIWPILLKVICGIQLILAVYLAFMSLVGLLLNGGVIYFFQAISFGFIATLPILSLIIFSNYFPNKKISGKFKRTFNRLFLVNFLLIAFLSGFFIRDYKELKQHANLVHQSIFKLDFLEYSGLMISILMFLFHLLILYGLVWQRQFLLKHAIDKQFDFEKGDS